MKEYKLRDLPYAYDALEPYISKTTMHFHHDMHHASYVKKLNGILAMHPEIANQFLTLEDLLKNLDKLPAEIRNGVRNNAGGDINHTMFWEMMIHPKNQKDENTEICEKIKVDFKSCEAFIEEFSNAAATVFGSGWAFLAYDKKMDKLLIVKTNGHDTPVSQGLHPIIVIDVWEHAYYLDYQNRRPEFIKNFIKLINWEKVNKYYLKARK